MLSLTKVPSSDTTNTTLLQNLWNESRRTVSSIRGGAWPWLEIQRTVDTVADQDYVYIPNDIRKVTGVRVVVGSGTSATIYLPRLVFDTQKWELILAYRLGSNQYPYFCYQQAQKLLFSPIPSVTGTHVTIIGRRKITDVNIADYTTGTITTLTSGATTVTASGSSWGTGMAGQWIRITQTAAANGGDGEWYEIASITSTTVLELVKPYQGTSIAGGTAVYTMGQITYEPEAYQMAPIYRAMALFYQINQPMQPEQANRYWKLYDGGQEAGLSTLVGGLIGQMLEESGGTFEGGYLSPGDNMAGPWSGVPYYFPTGDASGF